MGPERLLSPLCLLQKETYWKIETVKVGVKLRCLSYDQSESGLQLRLAWQLSGKLLVNLKISTPSGKPALDELTIKTQQLGPVHSKKAWRVPTPTGIGTPSVSLDGEALDDAKSVCHELGVLEHQVAVHADEIATLCIEDDTTVHLDSTSDDVVHRAARHSHI